jgi:hypothetical protein
MVRRVRSEGSRISADRVVGDPTAAVTGVRERGAPPTTVGRGLSQLATRRSISRSIASWKLSTTA